eukprot:scaffold4768_cov105-Isochrysis_galbana.AAC.3
MRDGATAQWLRWALPPPEGPGRAWASRCREDIHTSAFTEWISSAEHVSPSHCSSPPLRCSARRAARACARAAEQRMRVTRAPSSVTALAAAALEARSSSAAALAARASSHCLSWTEMQRA